MKKNLTLAEVKEIYGETCFETETSFGINNYGKYKPNITFIIPKEFALDKNGQPIDPLAFEDDKEVTDNMNVNWDGKASIIFGDFWRSKKGKACFKPKNPLFAKHLLIGVDWGGCFNSHRGSYGNSDALYFRRAKSNGGGSGVDYWVLPVGYVQIIRNEEIDGDAPVSDRSKLFEERARAYRQKHADRQRLEIEEADKFLREKFEAESEAKKAKAYFLPRLEAINSRLINLRESGGTNYEMEIGEAYFNFGRYSGKRLYNEENVMKTEDEMQQLEKWAVEAEVKRNALAAATAEFLPQFEELAERVQVCGWRIEIKSETVKIFEPYERRYNFHTYHEERCVGNFSFSKTSIIDCVKMIEAQEAKLAEERTIAEAEAKRKTTEAEAKAMGLPSDVRIWHRSGATNAGKGWVIAPNGMERECDNVDTSMHSSGNKRFHQSYEGDHVWNQILPGEVVLRWAHAYTAASHFFEVIYRPGTLTPAQEERIAEIEQGLEDQFFGQSGLTGTRSCPSVGDGWGLVKRNSITTDSGNSAMADAMRKAGIVK